MRYLILICCLSVACISPSEQDNFDSGFSDCEPLQIYSHSAHIGDDRVYMLTGIEDLPFAMVYKWDEEIEVFKVSEFNYYNNSIVVVGYPGQYIRILVVR